MFGPLEIWLTNLVDWFCGLFPNQSFLWVDINVYSILSVLLVSLICGAVGSLVVGNRMAFFSDALAHCSFASIAFALLLGLILNAVDESFKQWIFLILIVFGVGIGLLIAYVQETSGLPSDTVIGVFFAGAIGLGAVFVKAVAGRRFFNLESFLFGDPLFVRANEILWLVLLLLLTWVFLFRSYNTLVFASFNQSLALSRQLRVRACHYMFIALLGMIVNVCLQIVGVMLVNALLIVPAATAANGARNMRQLFWGAIVLGLFAGWAGIWLSWEIRIPQGARGNIQFGQGGIIVVLNVLLFILSLKLGPWLKNRKVEIAQAN